MSIPAEKVPGHEEAALGPTTRGWADPFNDNNSTGWGVTDASGATSGPSVWSASTGVLRAVA